MRKLVIIGLDGVSPWLIKELLAREKIPTIKKIIDRGFFTTLKSVTPPVSIPAWPSLVSGKNPGELGCFTLFSKKGYDKTIRPVQNFVPFWEELDVKCGIMNIPGTYPVKPMNGFMMSGLFTPTGASDFLYPAELKKEIDSELKDFAFSVSWNNDDDFLKRIFHLSELRFSIATKLYLKQKPDLFMLVETNTDSLLHNMMKYIDPSSPLYSSNKYEEKIYDYFADLDSLIGGFLKIVGEDVEVMIVSDHGFTSLQGTFALNKWLEDQGFLVVRGHSKGPQKVLSFFGINKTSMEKLLSTLHLKKLIYSRFRGSGLGDLIPDANGISWYTAVRQGMIDFKKTKAFSAIDQGFIYINDDSEEQGSVTKEEYHRVREEIIKSLQKIKIPGGELVVKKKEELFHGPLIEDAPDLVVFDKSFHHWPITAVRCPQLFNKVTEGKIKSGDHHSDGILISSQKSLGKKEYSLMDIHGIILQFFEKKSHVGGQAANSSFDEKKGEQDVIQRLEDLGYLG